MQSLIGTQCGQCSGVMVTAPGQGLKSQEKGHLFGFGVGGWEGDE